MEPALVSSGFQLAIQTQRPVLDSVTDTGRHTKQGRESQAPYEVYLKLRNKRDTSPSINSEEATPSYSER